MIQPFPKYIILDTVHLHSFITPFLFYLVTFHGSTVFKDLSEYINYNLFLLQLLSPLEHIPSNSKVPEHELAAFSLE